MKKELEKGLNDAWAESGPWPWLVGFGGPRNGGALAHREGRPERCSAARTTRSVLWSPHARRAIGAATSDGSNGEVRHDSRDELQ
jgi:hypothetical protein